MAWTYANWRQSTGSTRLTNLRLHIEEVTNEIQAERSGYGRSRSNTSLNDYLKRLELEEEKLANVYDSTRARFTRGRALFP